MVHLVPAPTVLTAAGSPPKQISEFIGRLATGTESVSVAVMESPAGWSEPGQTPAFDEYTIVIEGEVLVETQHGSLTATAGQAVGAPANEWVRYSTPRCGARYVAVCLPAFSPDAVNRDQAVGDGG